MGLSRDEIFEAVAQALVREFELDPAQLRLEAHLVDDLDLDSIDAIDLAVRLEEQVGVSFSEEDLKSVQTLGDVVDLIHERL
jgi:acyl carrier protein